MDAGDLAVGDQVWSREIGFAEVEAVEQRPALQPMFNLTVDEAHTFFVGDGQWLVHNKCVDMQIDYGADEMSRAAQQFRLDTFRELGGNVAVFRIEGDMPQSLIDQVSAHPNFLRIVNNMIVARNFGHSLHAEQVLDELIRSHTTEQFGIDNVTEVFSELSPCGIDSNNCRAMLDLYRNHLPLYYAEGWHGANQFFDRILPQLYRQGTPGVFR